MSPLDYAMMCREASAAAGMPELPGRRLALVRTDPAQYSCRDTTGTYPSTLSLLVEHDNLGSATENYNLVVIGCYRHDVMLSVKQDSRLSNPKYEVSKGGTKVAFTLNAY